MESRPVTILTGFLGAGKTTFLNDLMEKNSDIRYAIIENEFGETGIDSELIICPEQTIVELNNGCLCCTLNDSLYDILNELFDRKADFDEIIIEATGVADPTGLAQPFVSHQLIKQHFPLKGIICLVDAELIEKQLQETKEAKGQVAFSDVLLVNKTDLVDKNQTRSLLSLLRNTNPLAQIVEGNQDSFPTIDLSRKDASLENLFHQEGNCSHTRDEASQFPVHKPHSHHPHEHTNEINSQTFFFDTPFDYELLNHRLFVYLTLQASNLYRMKALVWIENSDQQYLVQSVGKRLDISQKRFWESTEQKQSTFVFIGKNLQRNGLERLLNQCLSKKTKKK
jgi:G3E family GTPase